MSVKGITLFHFFSCLCLHRGMDMRPGKTGQTGSTALLQEDAGDASYIERTGIIRYNKLNIAITKKHVRGVDIWSLNTA